MNKKELIDYCNALKENKSQIINCIDVNGIIKRIEQLDEPKKVVVPQFVADWYEEYKDDFEFNIWDWVAYSDESEKLENKEFNSWINDSEGNPIQTLVNMHQFGYEVEKEKRYLVKLKGVEGYGRYLNKVSSSKTYCFASENEKYGYITKHTRKQLEEDGFGWVFDCEGIEVEEVE